MRERRVTEEARTLGRRLADLRTATGHQTHAQIAARAGISASYLSLIERGLRSPPVETLAALAAALGVPLAALFVDKAALAGVAPDASDVTGQRGELISLVRSRRLTDWHVGILLTGAKLFAESPPGTDWWLRDQLREKKARDLVRAMRALLAITDDPEARRQIKDAIQEARRQHG